MKIKSYSYPKSSFLSIEKDLSIILDCIENNDRLKKLLYYTVKDPYNKPDLTEEQTYDLLRKNIKIIPTLEVDKEVLNYLIINFNHFTTNLNNPEFRDNIIEIDVVCHLDQWQLSDFQLRPYKIAAELDSMLSELRLTGLGKLDFYEAKVVVIDSEYACVCLKYEIIHGGEDKVYAQKPKEEQLIKDNFDKMFNNG